MLRDAEEELIARILSGVAQQLAELKSTRQQSQAPPVEYLTTKQAAALLGMGTSTLENWRAEGRGPNFLKLPGPNGAVRYARADLETWARERRRLALRIEVKR